MKRILAFVAVFLMIVCTAGGNVSAAKAKEVNFSPQDSCVFSMTKKGNMVLEMNIGRYPWDGKSNEIQKGRLVWKVSKDCKWSYCNIDRSNGKKSYRKANYKEIKEEVDSFRGNEGTMAYIWVSLTVRNNTVTKVVFHCMF